MKERPERKVIFEITGDGLTAEEVGRIRQVIRHLNYKRGRRKAPRLFYRYNFTQRKGDQTMSNNNYDAFRTFIEGRFGFEGGAEHEERRTEGAFY